MSSASLGNVCLGKVWLVGAGPGNPDLLTVKAHRLLSNAKVVAYDELISEDILAIIPATAERIPVGRRAGGVRYHEDKIHPLVLQRAREGLDVVRLKAAIRWSSGAVAKKPNGSPISISPLNLCLELPQRLAPRRVWEFHLAIAQRAAVSRL